MTSVPPGAGRAEQRERVLAAVLACAGRGGLARLTVDAVAVEAAVSRASVYRWFPGGRDQLIAEGVTWEVGRFLSRLAHAVERGTPDSGDGTFTDDVAGRLVRGLMFARRAITEHDVLQHLLETEPGGFLPQLQQTAPLATAVIRDYLRPGLDEAPLRPGVDADDAADYLARMVVSFMSTPGRWDLTDESQTRALVDTQLLAGITAP